MNDTVRAILTPIASLRITVVLFAMGMFLIFAGTLAQVELSNWDVVDRYFRALWVWIDLRYFYPGKLPESLSKPIWMPFLGGYAIGGAMLVNLLTAHALRFQIRARGISLLIGLAAIVLGILMLMAGHLHAFGDMLNLADQTTAHESATATTKVLFWIVWLLGIAVLWGASAMLFGKRDGIVLLHAGIVIMLVSEGVTGTLAVESQMHIYEGQTVQFSVDIRESELAIVQADHPDYNGLDFTTAISQSKLERSLRHRQPIRDPRLPFEVRVDHYLSNSALFGLRPGERPQVTHGAGRRIRVQEMPDVTGTEVNQSANMPSAIITLARDGQVIGQYLLSTWLERDQFPQVIEVDGKEYEIFLRFRRYYKPFSLELIEVRHDKFVGTEMARNFSSEVILRDPGQNEERRVLIYMNHPLRYAGETFFQSQVKSTVPGDTNITVLLLVDNPGAWMPYYSCLLVTVGMSVHFGRMLFKFAGRSLS